MDIFHLTVAVTLLLACGEGLQGTLVIYVATIKLEI